MYYNFPNITSDQLKVVALDKPSASRLPMTVRRERNTLVVELKRLFDQYGVEDREQRLQHLGRLVDILARLAQQMAPNIEIRRHSYFPYYHYNWISGFYTPLKTLVTQWYAPASLLDLSQYSNVTPKITESPDKYFFSYYDFIDVSKVKPLIRDSHHYFSIDKQDQSLLREYGYPLVITEDNFEQFLPQQSKHYLTMSNTRVYDFHRMGDQIAAQLLEAGFPLPQLRVNPGVHYSGGWTRVAMSDYIRRHQKLLGQLLTPQLARATVRLVTMYADTKNYNRKYILTGDLLITLCHLIVTVKTNPEFRLDPSVIIELVLDIQCGRTDGYGVARALYHDLLDEGFLAAVDQLTVFQRVTGLTVSEEQFRSLLSQIKKYMPSAIDGFNLEAVSEDWDCKSSSTPDTEWLQQVTQTESGDRAELCDKLDRLVTKGLMCGICDESLLDGKGLAVLPCNHLFHESEFAEYAEDSRECPECGIEWRTFKLN